jgi:hypothetical protein
MAGVLISVPGDDNYGTDDRAIRWIDCNGVNVFFLQILDQGHAGAFVLDHKRVIIVYMAPTLMELDDPAPEIWIFEPLTKDIQHVGCLSSHLHAD